MKDIDIVLTAKRRMETLKRKVPNADALKKLENELNIFWSRDTKKNKPTESGITLSKKLNVEERKKMRNILRSFLREETSTIQGIKAKFERTFKQYQKQLSPFAREQRKRNLLDLDVTKQYELIKKLDRTLQDQKFKESLGSGVLHDFYYGFYQQHNLNDDYVREAMLNVVSMDLEGMEQSQVVDAIIKEYNKIESEEDKKNDDTYK